MACLKNAVNFVFCLCEGPDAGVGVVLGVLALACEPVPLVALVHAVHVHEGGAPRVVAAPVALAVILHEKVALPAHYLV